MDYYDLLDIPRDQRPPSYYQLLRIPELEQDTEAIEVAVLDCYQMVNAIHGQEHDREALEGIQKLKSEIMKAGEVLCDPQAKRDYDTQLRRSKGLPEPEEEEEVVAAEEIDAHDNGARPPTVETVPLPSDQTPAPRPLFVSTESVEELRVFIKEVLTTPHYSGDQVNRIHARANELGIPPADADVEVRACLRDLQFRYDMLYGMIKEVSTHTVISPGDRETFTAEAVRLNIPREEAELAIDKMVAQGRSEQRRCSGQIRTAGLLAIVAVLLLLKGIVGVTLDNPFRLLYFSPFFTEIIVILIWHALPVWLINDFLFRKIRAFLSLPSRRMIIRFDIAYIMSAIVMGAILWKFVRIEWALIFVAGGEAIIFAIRFLKILTWFVLDKALATPRQRSVAASLASLLFITSIMFLRLIFDWPTGLFGYYSRWNAPSLIIVVSTAAWLAPPTWLLADLIRRKVGPVFASSRNLRICAGVIYLIAAGSLAFFATPWVAENRWTALTCSAIIVTFTEIVFRVVRLIRKSLRFGGRLSRISTSSLVRKALATHWRRSAAISAVGFLPIAGALLLRLVFNWPRGLFGYYSEWNAPSLIIVVSTAAWLALPIWLLADLIRRKVRPLLASSRKLIIVVSVIYAIAASSAFFFDTPRVTENWWVILMCSLIVVILAEIIFGVARLVKEPLPFVVDERPENVSTAIDPDDDQKVTLSQNIGNGREFLTLSEGALDPHDSPKLISPPFASSQLVVRKVGTMWGHSSSIRCLCFSPDDRLLASGSTDNTVKLWDIRNGRDIVTLTGHLTVVMSVSFSPDEKLLVSGSLDKSIKLWDISTGREVLSTFGHADGVTSVCFSPSGKSFASAGMDNLVKLWHLSNRNAIEEKALFGHSGVVYSTSFSPNGRLLASASLDGTIKLWNVANGLEEKTLSGHSSSVYSVDFSSNGELLASGGDDKTIKLWLVSNGREKRTLLANPNIVDSVRFSPNGELLASGANDNMVKLWFVSNGQEAQRLVGHSAYIYSVVFSSNGRLLASGSDDRSIKIWQLKYEEGGET